MEIRTIKLKLLRGNESGFSFVSPITQYIILLFAIRICSEVRDPVGAPTEAEGGNKISFL